MGWVFEARIAFSNRFKLCVRSFSAFPSSIPESTPSNPLIVSFRKVVRRWTATTLARCSKSSGKSMVVFIRAVLTGVWEYCQVVLTVFVSLEGVLPVLLTPQHRAFTQVF